MLNRARAATLLPADKRILVVGEMMLDEFIWGKVSRISPEAPVPVVQVAREEFLLGGAANVARNLRQFVHGVEMLSLTGTGGDAGQLAELLTAEGIGLTCVEQDPAYTTIRKTRIIARTQHVVRVDREGRASFSPEAQARVLEKFEALLPSLDAIIMEDYDKGLITQPLADAITQRARRAGIIVNVDPKPSNNVEWHDITCVTPNRGEAFRAAGQPLSDPVDPPTEDQPLLEVGRILLEKWKCEHLLITLSEQGMILFHNNDTAPHHIPTRAQKVYDVSGAGDTAIAVCTVALAAGATPAEAAELANHASGIVVGKLGTATVSREELLASFDE